MNRRRAIQIAFCGPGNPTDAERQNAFDIGRAIALSGASLLCGGLGGSMEAVCRGAKQESGTTIGILPGDDASSANEFVDNVIATGMGQARNVVLVTSADAVIAAGGGYGTLSEIAHALRIGKPVVLIGRWVPALTSLAPPGRDGGDSTPIVVAESPQDAVSEALAAINRANRR